MKINRLIEITTILLNRKTVTATELAERFGVSTRTIYRDIDVLSTSGVPVVSMQGANGGISILEDYTLNRTSLSEKESENIIFALQAMQVTKYPEIDTILDKLGSLFRNSATDWISIDFSPWGSNPNEYNKFETIRTAVIQSKMIEVDYINAFNQKSHRKLAPLRLIFKGQAWYLWAFCHDRRDFRTFRISRMKDVQPIDETFERSSLVNQTGNENEKEINIRPNVHLLLQFTEAALYRLYDDYDDSVIINNGDGTYTLELDFPEDDWVYGYILSFGENVKVIEPAYIRNIIIEKAEKMLNYYR